MPKPSVSMCAEGGVRWSRRSVLLAGGLLIAGCGGPDRPVIESEEYKSDYSNYNSLRKILERRAKALTEKDEEGYLADLDRSNEELIRREKLLFANLRQFDFADFRYVLSGITEQPVGKTFVFGPVIRTAKLTADAGPGDVAPAETFQYKLRKQGDRLVVGDIVAATTDEDRQKLRLVGPLADAPWHTDELRVVKVSGKVWLAGDRTATDLDRYASLAERELREVEKLWGGRTSFPGHVLFFTRAPANMRRWFNLGSAGNFNPDNLGYQIPLYGVRKGGGFYQNQFAASRIVVNLAAIEAHDSQPANTIRHELTHAVTARAQLTDGGWTRPPTWAIEGFARYTETIGSPERASRIRDVVAAGVRAGKFKGTTPPSDTFYGKDIIFNYVLGSTVFSLAEQRRDRQGQDGRRDLPRRP
ncbi:hypothetical protein K1W54_09300 [Micromonospora sp. CPCC 205371]|nr:hypothetical protein [Micromonospora sp. CPCC 205371]